MMEYSENMRTAALAEQEQSQRPAPPIPDPAGRWALFLDVDGTLLELAVAPDAVRIPGQLRPLLARLHQQLDGALALVSGRSIVGIDELFAPLRLPSAGLHGLERRDARGALLRTPIDRHNLELMRQGAYRLADAMPDVLVEDKGYTVAFHFRTALQQQSALHAAVQDVARQSGFAVQAGHYVYELKPAGVHKGCALEAFLAEPPFAGRTPIFLGDDLTDEYALETTRRLHGTAIQVGPRPSIAAHYALADPAAVLYWLSRWQERLS
jgi:trehalose 6-phosphate phosphatase